MRRVDRLLLKIQEACQPRSKGTFHGGEVTFHGAMWTFYGGKRTFHGEAKI